MSNRPSAVDRIRRDAAIVAERARGAAQTELASRYGISVRQVRNICTTASGPVVAASLSRAEELLLGVMSEYDDLQAELQALPKAQPNIQLGAVKARLQLLRDRTHLLQATALIPAEMYAVDHQQQAMRIVEIVLDAFEEFNVPVDVQRTIVERVEAVGKSGGAARLAEAELPVGEG